MIRSRPNQTATVGTAGRAAQDGGTTQRGWWDATRERWSQPAEWTVWNLVILASLVVLLTFAAIWVTRPGRPLGTVETYSAGLVYSDAESGRFIYELFETPGSRPLSAERLRTTLQSIYEAHRTAMSGKQMTITILSRDTSIEPYVLGAGNPSGQGVIAHAIIGPEVHEAFIRRGERLPPEPIQLQP